jgi:hypothetical protein
MATALRVEKLNETLNIESFEKKKERGKKKVVAATQQLS